MKEIYKDESTTICLGDGQIRIYYQDKETKEGIIFHGFIATLAQAMAKMMKQESEHIKEEKDEQA